MKIDQLRSGLEARNDILDLTVRIYLLDPQKINNMDSLKRYGAEAASRIESLKQVIETLQAYEQLCYERAQELVTSPYHYELHLIRENRYYIKPAKIFYHIDRIKIYDKPGIKPETLDRKTYQGKDRRAALSDFAALQKANPGIIAVKKIDKEPWE